MAPMLRDDGPPVSATTIEEARRTLPAEYGYKIVEESGRRVLLVRVPGPRPDYLHALEQVALYVDLDEVRDVRDVLLVGSEKVTRLEPIALRDHIRTQRERDRTVAQDLDGRLARDYGHLILDAETGHGRGALAVRVPRGSLSEITPSDVLTIRERLRPVLQDRIREVECAYILSDSDSERLGRRVFLELVDPAAAAAAAATPPAPAREALMQAVRGASSDEAGVAAPAASPAPTPVRDEDAEYEILSSSRAAPSAVRPAPKPTAATAEAMRPPTPTRTPSQADSAAAFDRPLTGRIEVSREPAPRLGTESPVMRDSPPVVAGFMQTMQDENTEVYVRKPTERRSVPAPASAPKAATTATAPPVATEDEYEIFDSRKHAPTTQSTTAGPIGDSGGDVDVRVGRLSAIDALDEQMAAAAAAEGPSFRMPSPAPPGSVDFDVLQSRLEGLGYEVVRDVPVKDVIFEIAAHKPGGRRILAVQSDLFVDSEVPDYDEIGAELGADVVLVVAKHVEPGARLATWGTRVEVFRPSELVEIGL